MSYTLSTLDDGRIISLSEMGDFDVQTDVPQFFAEVYDLLEDGPERMVIIGDGRDLWVDVRDILNIGGAVRSAGAALVEHPHLQGIILVPGSGMSDRSIRELSRAAAGSVKLRLASTVEEAFNAARDLLYSQAKAS